MPKHLTLAQINPDNLRYYVKKPDSDFSAERNYKVIEEVIAENDRMQTKLNGEVKENAGNVADILAHFAKYKLDQGGGKKLEGYLGKHWQTKIYSEKLIEKIR